MLKFLAPISLMVVSMSAFAGTVKESNYTYQVQVIAGQTNCAAEAAQWSQRFASATGAKVSAASCRGEQELSADKKTYKVYNLGLNYQARFAFNSYTVDIGKRDSLSPVGLTEEVLYGTLDSCLADLANQTALYEAETGLKAVTATCISGSPYAAVTQYFLRIEGFDSNKDYGRPQPKKYLYTFAPYAFQDLPQSRQTRISEIITSYDATIAKEGPGIFVYYRAGGQLPLSAQDVNYNKNAAECEAQLDAAHAIYVKAGSTQVMVWCTDSRLEIIHDGTYYLNNWYGSVSNLYGSFEQCVADKDFVLSDSRNSLALGALCAPGTYDYNTYTMTLFRKGY